MRSTALKMFTVLLGSVILLSTSSFKGPGKPAKPAKYTGHWISVSGGEYYEMGKADLSEDVFEKNSKGEVKSIDKNKVKSKLNFREGAKVNGKNAEETYFVISMDEPSSENATNTESLVSSYPRLLTANCTPTSPGIECNYVKAIFACHGVQASPFVAASNMCTSGYNGFCLAFAVGGFPIQYPYYFYIMCN